MPLSEMVTAEEAGPFHDAIRHSLRSYRRTLLSDRRAALEGFRRILLHLGRDGSDPLLLQFNAGGSRALRARLRVDPRARLFAEAYADQNERDHAALAARRANRPRDRDHGRVGACPIPLAVLGHHPIRLMTVLARGPRLDLTFWPPEDER